VPKRTVRQWEDARRKVEEEGRCRICGVEPVEAAHLFGRVLDEVIGQTEDGKTLITIKYVDPLAVAPLCKRHHEDYDQKRLDLSPYIRFPEMAWVVERVGIERARNRFTGKKEVAA
jgi:hypothetical protein